MEKQPIERGMNDECVEELHDSQSRERVSRSMGHEAIDKPVIPTGRKAQTAFYKEKGYPLDQIALIRRLEKTGTASFRIAPSIEGRLRV